ncbi:DUF6255 family natural product biosynthesis protein [Streptomyces abikoensis]|uniref:DUF6255 family natural product biosynthesis protein n=1 Tax=Streptomyces abikoensis TaxID=97398 RepID=A0ABW7T2I5_9ACTN
MVSTAGTAAHRATRGRSACGNRPGWAHSGGELRCHHCGVRRSATTYGARRAGGGTMGP